MANKRNLTTRTTIQNLITEQKKVFATIANLTATDNKVNTLIGTDTGKSVRTIANEELAAQLIPENAGSALDTLQEIAMWIQDHPGDASAMNASIQANANKLELGTHQIEDPENPGESITAQYDTVKDYVTAVSNGLYDSVTSDMNSMGSNVNASIAALDNKLELGTHQIENPENPGESITAEYDTVKDYVTDVSNGLGSRITAIETIAPTKTAQGSQNGYILIDDVSTLVYSLPADVLSEDDIVDYTGSEIAAMLADNGSGSGSDSGSGSGN